MIKHVYEIDRSELQGALAEAMAKLTREQILDKFSLCQVHSTTVCDIWDISLQTLSSYIKSGIVVPVNKGSSKHLFNLADILAMPNPKRKRGLTASIAS